MTEAIDIYYDKERNMYQQIFVKYNLEDKTAEVVEVKDISPDKYKIAYEMQKVLSDKLSKLNTGV